MTSGNPEKFCATLVRSSAPAFAALTADKLVERRPSIVSRYAPNATTQWRSSLSTRIGYLAAALETGRAAMFVDQAMWARVAHSSRGGTEGVADLKTALECLDEVICEELPANVGVLASGYVRQAVDALSCPLDLTPPGLSIGRPSSELASGYLMALLEGDRRKAASLVLDAVTGPSRVQVREIYLTVFSPVLAELGRMWHLGETSVGTEHFATATTQLVMSLLYPHFERAPSRGSVFVAGSVEGNAHDLGLRMVADFLEMDGWRSVYLGPSVPPEDMAEAAEDFRADLVGLSATIATHLPAIGTTVRAIRSRLTRPVRVLVGGTGFSATGQDPAAMALELGADAYAASLDDAVAAARCLAGRE